jgi:molecular chaperone IbpA
MYNLNPLLTRQVLGFEKLFDRLERLSKESQPSYPPYNIRKDGDKIYVELAVAGLSKNDINIELVEGTLNISHESKVSDKEYMHRGIAERDFRLQFTLAEYIEVKGAKLENGLLIIDLEKVIPEDKKPKTIKIK